MIKETYYDDDDDAAADDAAAADADADDWVGRCFPQIAPFVDALSFEFYLLTFVLSVGLFKL